MNPAWRKPLISVAIGVHILAIGLQNLPAQRSLQGLYRWYIGLSGQLQGWVMFSKTSAQCTRIELVTRSDDGRASQPFGPSKEWPGAVLDVAADAFASEKTASAFFGALRATYPIEARPVEIRLSLLHKPMAELGASAALRPTEFVVAKEFIRRW